MNKSSTFLRGIKPRRKIILSHSFPQQSCGVFWKVLDKKGITLIELLIALVISAVLIAGVYRTFISQQRTYTVQEQVVEMQQNVRGAINKMIREIRMAGFGSVTDVLPVNDFGQIFTTNANNITVVGGFKQVEDNGTPITVTALGPGANEITLSAQTDEFNGAAHRYLSIGGLASYRRQPPYVTTNIIRLDRNPATINPVGHFVFKVQAITYDINALILRRNENTGGGAQPLADNIEGLVFLYPTTDTIQISITARTKDPDPDFRGGDGYRRRQISSTIKLRNVN